MDIEFLTITRERGTVEVVSTEQGWSIIGRGKTGTLRMRINRCACNKHVCPTLHPDGMYGSGAGTATIYSCGSNVKHGRNHCHGGHVERVRSVIKAIAKTYGPRVRGQ